jgi:hypothetical protein
VHRRNANDDADCEEYEQTVCAGLGVIARNPSLKVRKASTTSTAIAAKEMTPHIAPRPLTAARLKLQLARFGYSNFQPGSSLANRPGVAI